MMQAPCSLNALVWGVMRRDGTSAALLLGTSDLRVSLLTTYTSGLGTADTLPVVGHSSHTLTLRPPFWSYP